MQFQQTLTKENFWDELLELYPHAMKDFCGWLDEYKKEINWLDLFGGVKQREHYWGDIKFHHLPYAMQQGIWIEFASQRLNEHFEQPEYFYSMKLEDDVRAVLSELEDVYKIHL